MTRSDDLLVELQERIKGLEQQAELIKTVLIVKEPNTIQSAQAFDGLRKQVVASAAERRSHLMQLVAIAVGVSRATSVDDLRPQVQEWLDQAGIVALAGVPEGADADHVFEDIGGKGLNGPLEVVEPAFVDVGTQSVLRLGRARLAGPASAPAKKATATAPTSTDEPGNEPETTKDETR